MTRFDYRREYKGLTKGQLENILIRLELKKESLGISLNDIVFKRITHVKSLIEKLN